MIVRLVLLFSLIYANTILACNFINSTEIDLPPELAQFTPNNCHKRADGADAIKDEFCDCIAQENAKYALDFGTTLYASYRKAALNRLWEHHEKSIYSLSDTFLELETLGGDKDKIGKQCQKLLKDDLVNLSCGNKKTILAPEVIKNLASKVYGQAAAVSYARFHGKNIESVKDIVENDPYFVDVDGLSRRLNIPREQNLICPDSNAKFSEVELLKYESKAIVSFANSLKSLLEEIPLNLRTKYPVYNDLVSSDEFYEFMLSDPNLMNKVVSFSNLGSSNKQLSMLMGSPDLIDLLQDPSQIESKIHQKNSERLMANCKSVKENTIKILCSDNAANILPKSYKENKAIIKSMENRSQGNSDSINFYQANNLSSSFCSDLYNKDYESGLSSIQATFPVEYTDLVKSGSSEYNSGNELKFGSVPNAKKLMCPYFPPPEENRERLAAKVAECDANPDTVLSYECIMVKTISADFTAKEEALIKAKTLSLQAQDLPDEEIEKKVKEYKKSLGTDELLAKSEPKGPLKEFLKADKSDTQVAETKTNEKRSERGEAYDGSSSAGFGGELSNGELASSDQNSQGMLNRTPAEIVNSPEVNRNVQKNMNDLYDEVRRRIQTAKTAHQNSPLGQKSKSVPSYLAPAFDMPKTASDDTGGAAIAATPSGIEGQNLMPGGNGFLPPLDPTSTEASAAESYNKALLDANEAKQARKAAEAAQAARAAGRSPASSGPSPIAISGFGPNALHTEIPSLTISGGLDEALDKMLQGDFDNAELLLDLLKADKKTILIVPEKNPKYAVRVEKRGDTYLVTPENPEMVDADYRVFVDSIKKSLNIKDRFKTFVAKLQGLLRGQNENGQRVPAGVDVLNNLFD